MDRRIYLKTYRAEYKGRHKRVNLTLSLTDFKRLERLSSRDGKPITTIACDHLMAALDDRPYVPERVAAELTDLKFLLSNIANNINQMAHYSHTVRQFTAEGQLLTEVERLQGLIEAYTRKKLRGTDDH